ncbi:MAG: DUF1905 domain-containing protein [Bacteroidetes bacterium]|nr:MAG: DUF1905 domain-containing protein [Bacteroidota bacterium]
MSHVNTDHHSWEAHFESELYLLEKLKLRHIVIPYDVLQELADEDDKSVYQQRFWIAIDDCEPWQAGSVALGEQNAYISIKSALLKKMGLQIGDHVQVKLRKDRSEYGMPFPEELQEVLLQDPEADKRFHELNLGMRRYIIYYVNQVKSSQKKIERSLFLIGNLKEIPTNEVNFRLLLGKKD